MEKAPNSAYQIESLAPNEFQIAREQNEAELGRHSRTRIFIIEETRTFPDRMEFTYGWYSYEVPVEAKDQVRPGGKILMVQRSEALDSPIEEVYALGENLKKQAPAEPNT